MKQLETARAKKRCWFCQAELDEIEYHNTSPVVDDEVCCRACNENKVLPARTREYRRDQALKN